MKALELSDALRDFAAIYGDADVVFYEYTDFGIEVISADLVTYVDGRLVLDEDVELSGDLIYVKGGEWIDGKRRTD